MSLLTYESDQLISMIGSKRMLQLQMRELFKQLIVRPQRTLFLDPFCGSGAIARIARALGCKVLASDIEPWTFIVNYVYLTLNQKDLTSMFVDFGGLDGYLSLLHLNGLYRANEGQDLPYGYLSAHYGPQDDEQYDGNRERLFFSRFNALYFDTIRHDIEEAWIANRISAEEKCVILALLLYEIRCRANISGTFSSYHKTFGSRDKTGRTRVFAQPTLQAPILAPSETQRGIVALQDALEVVPASSVDFCYLDVPATVHQYGSTCHLLNSVAMWDYLIPNNERNAAGELVDRAGLRSDRKQTYSPFCSHKRAGEAMVTLLNRVDAGTVVLSYPSRGILNPKWLEELLLMRFKEVKLLLLERPRRGGRQSRNSLKGEYEHLLIASRGATFSLLNDLDWQSAHQLKTIGNLRKEVFYPGEDFGPFTFSAKVLLDYFELEQLRDSYSLQELTVLQEALTQRLCSDQEEAIKLLATALDEQALSASVKERLERKLLSLLRTLSFDHCWESFGKTYDFLVSNVRASATLQREIEALYQRLQARERSD